MRTKLLCAAAAAALILAPASALAHERRAVGAVQVVVGWAGEPAYAGYLNAVQLALNDGAGGPITDLGDTLKVEVLFGDQKVGPVALEPAFGRPGDYRAPIIPSRAGVYTFHFVGTIRGQAFDQSFTSSDTTFDSVKSPEAIAFPVKDPSAASLATRIERVAARADDAASTARTTAIVGIAVGALALVGAVVALVRR